MGRSTDARARRGRQPSHERSRTEASDARPGGDRRRQPRGDPPSRREPRGCSRPRSSPCRSPSWPTSRPPACRSRSRRCSPRGRSARTRSASAWPSGRSASRPSSSGRIAGRAGRSASAAGRCSSAARCSARSSLALHVVTTDLAVLVGLRLLLGVAEAFFFVAGFAMVADLAPPNRAGEALSFNSLSLYLGIALGPIIGFAAARHRRVRPGLGSAVPLCRSLAAVLAMADPGDRRAGAAAAAADAALQPARRSGRRSRCSAGSPGWPASWRSWRSTRRGVGMTDAGPVLLLFGLIVVGLPGRVRPAARSRAAVPARRRRPGAERDRPDRRWRRRRPWPGCSSGPPCSPSAWRSRRRRSSRRSSRGSTPSERGSAFGTASLFLDLAFGGGPVVLGLVAQTAGIPAAFLVAAVVTMVGAAGTAAASIEPLAAPARSGALTTWCSDPRGD